MQNASDTQCTLYHISSFKPMKIPFEACIPIRDKIDTSTPPYDALAICIFDDLDGGIDKFTKPPPRCPGRRARRFLLGKAGLRWQFPPDRSPGSGRLAAGARAARKSSLGEGRRRRL